MALRDIYRWTVEKGLYSSQRVRGFISYSLERVERAFESGKVVILRAPPGIGKTAVPITLLLAILKGDFQHASSVIHVAPTRSLIDDLAKRVRGSLAKLVGDKISAELVARQHGFAHETYGLMALYTITTFDTYLYNLYKLPTDEIMKIYRGSYGHYEVPRSLIFSAVNFLDEVHMAIEEETNMANAVIESIRALASFKIPSIVSTATLSNYLLNSIAGLVGGSSIDIVDYESYISQEVDEFYKIESSKVFKPLGGDPLIKVKDLCNTNEDPLERLVRELLDIVESGGRASIVVNTIEVARCIYSRLRDRGNVIIIHSRFTPEDRVAKLKELENNKGVLLISTQVLEVGVDMSFDAMISQISPPSSLIQRMGRLARGEDLDEGLWAILASNEDLERGSGVYHPDLIAATMDILKPMIDRGRVNWHLPKSVDGSFTGYMDIIDAVWASSCWRKPYLGSQSFFEALTNPLINSTEVYRFLKIIGGFRDDNICSLYVCKDEECRSLDDKDIWSRSVPIPCNQMLSYAEKAIGKGFNVYLLERSGSIGLISLGGSGMDLNKLKKELNSDPLSFPIKYPGIAIPSTLYDGGVCGIGLKDL
jgi:CRISPR-associated endonuclease/helicase Cas3